MQKTINSLIDEINKEAGEINKIRDEQELSQAIPDYEQQMIEYDNTYDEQGRLRVHYTAKNGYSLLSEKLLPDTKIIHAQDGYYLTPLHYACKNNQNEMVNLILQGDEDTIVKCANTTDKSQKLPIYYAMKNGNIEVVKQLAPYSNYLLRDKEQRPLLQQAFLLSSEALDILLHCIQNRDASAILTAGDISGKTILHYTVEKQDLLHTQQLLKMLGHANLTDKKSQLPLHCAAYLGNNDLVELLLPYTENINLASKGNGLTPLHHACRYGTARTVEAILNHNAEKKSEYINTITNDNNSCLHYAALNNKTEIVNLLLPYMEESIISLQNNTEKSTALHYAVLNNNLEMTRMICNQNTSPQTINASDSNDRTALNLAASLDNLEISRLLIRNGANPHFADQNGFTPLTYAELYDNYLLSELLRQAMDTRNTRKGLFTDRVTPKTSKLYQANHSNEKNNMRGIN